MGLTLLSSMLLVLLTSTAFVTAQADSCMVRLFMKAGLSQDKAAATEKTLITSNITPRQLARTPAPILALILKTTADETEAIQTCTRRQSEECKTFEACEHGGKCMLGKDSSSYTCQCKEKFSGSFCEKFDGVAGQVQALASDMKKLLEKVNHLTALSLRQHANEPKPCKKDPHPRSCKDIKKESPNSKSGTYSVRSASDEKIKVHCEMEREGGGWTRILHIDAAATNQCPGQLRLINPGRKLCTRPSGLCGTATAVSPIGPYSEVMGFATGYKDKSTDCFRRIGPGRLDIDASYVDGVSITRGSPKKHLWTYASSFSEDRHQENHCPCNSIPGKSPSFVGEHYYCADHAKLWDRWAFDSANHMWSSTSRCDVGSKCCQDNKRPWFVRNIGHTVKDEIQLRVCLDQSVGDEQLAIDRSEIYVR